MSLVTNTRTRKDEEEEVFRFRLGLQAQKILKLVKPKSPQKTPKV